MVFNPIALRKAKIAYNFGLSQCYRVIAAGQSWERGDIHFSSEKYCFVPVHVMVISQFKASNSQGFILLENEKN